MGILSKFGLATRVASDRVGILSPWADSSHLVKIMAMADLLQATPDTLPDVTPLDALKVPAIAKGRAILHSLIAAAPLRAYTAEGTPVKKQPTWLYRSDTGVSPRTRNAQILDDHIFWEASLLATRRGDNGDILDAVRVPYDEWEINDDNQIEVQGNVVDEAQVLYIPGPGPGLIALASDTIRAARDMDAAWMQRVRTPVPPILLNEREDNGMTPEEAKVYVDAVAQARRNPNGGVMFVPAIMEAILAEPSGTDLFESGRNALRLDIANFLNIPAALLDGSVSEASLTYSTQEGKRNELFDYTVPYWSQPIEQVLSLDNVVPRGQRVRFDFSTLLTTVTSPTGAPSED